MQSQSSNLEDVTVVESKGGKAWSELKLARLLRLTYQPSLERETLELELLAYVWESCGSPIPHCYETSKFSILARFAHIALLQYLSFESQVRMVLVSCFSLSHLRSCATTFGAVTQRTQAQVRIPSKADTHYIDPKGSLTDKIPIHLWS